MPSALRIKELRDLNDNVMISPNGLILHSFASAPSSPVEGQMYYNSSTLSIYAYLNGNWVKVSSGFNTSDPFLDGSQIFAYEFEQNMNDVNGTNTGVNSNAIYSVVNNRVNSGTYCVEFGGDGDWVGYPTSLVPSGDSARSYSLWTYLYSGSSGTRQLLVGTGNHGTTASVFDIEANVYHNGPVPYYGIHWWGNGQEFVDAGNAGISVIYDQWVHLTITHAGGNLNYETKLYINGVYKGNLNPINQTFNTSSAITHQSGFRTAYSDLPVNGAIDTYRAFNKELNFFEVQELYSRGG
ncbi:hypothetical protein EB155_12070 [archaeon]|nr:hypothetical protein [archaeon]